MLTFANAQIISGIWIEIVHNLRVLLDSIKGSTHQRSLSVWSFMSYFVDNFLIIWSGFTQHQSIYLSRWLEYRKIQGICGIYCMYSLVAFSNTNVVSFFGNKIAYLCNFESNFFNMVTSLYEHHATFVISLQKDIKCVIKVFFFQKCYRRH